jgi:hypothetical protein
MEVLVSSAFKAKEVPVELISLIGEQREYHRPDWPAVRDAVAGTVEGFDYYFDFLIEQLEKLEPVWNV